MAYTYCPKCGAKVEWADSCSECGASIPLFNADSAATRTAETSQQRSDSQAKPSAPPWPKAAESRWFPVTGAIVITVAVLILLAIGGVTIYEFLKPPGFQAPANFRAAAGAMEVRLSWVKSDRCDTVWVVYREDGYPTSPTDGTLVYEGSEDSFVHGDLGYGIRYYYGIWAVRYVDGEPEFSSAGASYSASPAWRGPMGETLREFVEPAPDVRVVGADGGYIELVNNPAAKDPSWDELRQFLLQDTTDEMTYNEATFVCADFAEMLHNNAEAVGIRAAYVTLDFVGQSTGHALNAFNTTDRGIVYVDDTAGDEGISCPQDRTVDLQLEHEYIAESVFECEAYSVTWPSMGTVSDFQVQW